MTTVKDMLAKFLPQPGQLEMFGERQVVTPSRRMWLRRAPSQPGVPPPPARRGDRRR